LAFGVVVPAKAATQGGFGEFLDSRLRGNDGERPIQATLS